VAGQASSHHVLLFRAPLKRVDPQMSTTGCSLRWHLANWTLAVVAMVAALASLGPFQCTCAQLGVVEWASAAASSGPNPGVPQARCSVMMMLALVGRHGADALAFASSWIGLVIVFVGLANASGWMISPLVEASARQRGGSQCRSVVVVGSVSEIGADLHELCSESKTELDS